MRFVMAEMLDMGYVKLISPNGLRVFQVQKLENG